MHLAIENAFIVLAFAVSEALRFADFRQIDASVIDAFLFRITRIIAVRVGTWGVRFARAIHAFLARCACAIAWIAGVWCDAVAVGITLSAGAVA